MDRRTALILLPDKGRTGQLDDATERVAALTFRENGSVAVTFAGSKLFTYGPGQVRVLRDPRSVPVQAGARIEVDGQVWEGAVELLEFGTGESVWVRVCSPSAEGVRISRAYPRHSVHVLSSAEGDGTSAAAVMSYLRSIASRLPPDNDLRRGYERLTFVHPDSALARYLAAAPIVAHEPAAPSLFPFRRNLSQWAAVDTALTHPMSVVHGPPGTGKTETILNLVCSLVGAGRSVGVVSMSNAAVDNVRDKLRDADLGVIAARLGNRETREAFFTLTAEHAADRARLLAAPVSEVPQERLALLDGRLRSLYQTDAERAAVANELAAYRLEHEHFQQHLARLQPPPLAELPLLHRSPERILRFLAETTTDTRARPGMIRRLRRYLTYGPLHGLDPHDGEALLHLQDAFYRQTITRLEERLYELTGETARADFDLLVREHGELCDVVFRSHLQQRYRSHAPTTFAAASYNEGRAFDAFVAEYPVILSTCHSLRSSLARGYLLDYLVIDEASQVDILVAAPAMAACRNLVVVGDSKQLSHIDTGAADGLRAPHPAYDYGRNSILDSVLELYGNALPTTLLREHYRCDPTIIGFCNRAFYDDALIPYRTGGVQRPMEVRPTAPGNHHRRHHDGARSNQRELDVIVKEVFPDVFASNPDSDIGITTPYRRQADKAADMLLTPDLLDRAQADTVHKFQGRQMRVVVLSTVIDNTWRGQTGMPFADDPKLINVAVSRAVDRFVLVIDHQYLPRSRHITDLVNYIRYQHPDSEPAQSSVVSVFDLLYQQYSQVLRPLAKRVGNGSAYKSENIMDAVLADLLGRDGYRHLVAVREVRVQDLLAGPESLTPQERAFVRHARTAVDFVVYSRVGNVPRLAIEVDGFAFHEDRPDQLRRDAMKDEILARYGLPVLRLSTTGSDEISKIKTTLKQLRAVDDRRDRDQHSTVVDVREGGAVVLDDEEESGRSRSDRM